MVSLARKEIWFRGIFHLIGILGESPFVSKLRKAESAQHSVQWTGGYAPRFQAFFSALGFFPVRQRVSAHLPLTRAVGWLRQVRNVVYFYLDQIERTFYNLVKEIYHEKNYCA
jgi:hypothetical protein